MRATAIVENEEREKCTVLSVNELVFVADMKFGCEYVQHDVNGSAFL